MAISIVDTEVERLLLEGKDAARAGNNELARSLLTQVVERDPHNEQAWMWLSGVVSEPEEQQICLENVLVINPYNAKARKGLEFLSTKTGVPTTFSTSAEHTAPLSDMSATGIQLPFGGDEAAEYPAAPEPFAPQSYSASPAASGAGALPDDPWSGNGGTASPPNGSYSDNSLNIDWSRGQDLAPAPGGEPFSMQANSPSEQWPGMDLFAQAANDGSAGAPPWSLDGNMQGFEPVQPGALQAGPPPSQGNGGGPAQSEDWNGTGMLSPMSISGDYQLPNPTDLPGYTREAQPEAKPWYAQSSQLDPAMMSHTGNLAGVDPNNPDELTRHLNSFKDKPTVMVQCPNCHEEVPDTALSCPTCNFSFFINCPHCHELVDTIDAKAGAPEPCPYCSTSLDRMQLGMSNADPTSSYVSEKAPMPKTVVPKMTQYVEGDAASRGYSWSWVVDFMWLVAIAVMVWALTQIPAWFHLAGQY